MRKTFIFAALLAIACLGFNVTANADTSTLQINGGAGDPNLVSGGSFNVLQNSGGVGTIDDLILLFSVAAGSPAPSGLTSSMGTLGSISLVGNLAGSASCAPGAEVYSCAGLTQINGSNNLTNFNGALTANSLPTSSSFDIYEVTITGADLAAKGSLTVGGNLGVGTFIDAFGTIGDTPFGTPFTEAGLTISTPEPATLAMLGFGLIGVPFLRRKRS
jgi:PEP-CTERM motif